MRNFLAHEYADVDDEAVFSTIKNDLPTLKEVSKTILADLDNEVLDEYLKK